MDILVTGGAGPIGIHLSMALVAREDRGTVLGTWNRVASPEVEQR